jgi:hypothetical protein
MDCIRELAAVDCSANSYGSEFRCKASTYRWRTVAVPGAVTGHVPGEESELPCRDMTQL